MTYHQLTQEERYAITAQLMCGRWQAHIAQFLGRDRSTISRELRRNPTHHDGKYRAEKAHSYAGTTPAMSSATALHGRRYGARSTAAA